MSKAENNDNPIVRLFRDSLNIEVGSDDTDLIDEGLLDSLMLVDLLMHLEQDYGITIDFDDLELDNFRSVRAIGAFIEQRRTIQAGSGL